MKNKLSAYVLGAGATVIGLAVGIAGMASAQTSTTTNTPPVSTVSSVTSSTMGTPAAESAATEAAEPKTQGHRPLGGDGVISSINGTTIVMAEESDEGAASYTVDASKATVTNNGATATLADLKVGDKVFVDGTTTGTSVAATSISLGHGGHGPRGNDNDVGGVETPDTTSTQ